MPVVATVTEIEPIARRMRRIRLGGDEVSRLEWTPGQHVRVHVTDMRDPRNWLRPRDMLRTYSVWNYDGGLELCVFDHGAGRNDGAAGDRDDEGGPGARWASELRTGQRVTIGKPEGSFVLREAPYYVFAGEETAAVSFGPMLRALPQGRAAHAVLEVDEPDDQLPLDSGDVTWLYRHGESAASSESLVKGLAGRDLPDEPGIAYFAGEARTIQLLRRHLVDDRGWPRRAIVTKPFWTPGRRGLD